MPQPAAGGAGWRQPAPNPEDAHVRVTPRRALAAALHVAYEDPAPGWFPPVAPTVEEIAAANRAFAAAVAGLSDEELLGVDPAFGAIRLEIVLSTLAHTGYHAGELATLQLALVGGRGWEPLRPSQVLVGAAGLGFRSVTRNAVRAFRLSRSPGTVLARVYAV